MPFSPDYQKSIEADNAVADAMMSAQYQTIEHVLPLSYPQGVTTMEALLEKASSTMCHVASGLVIQHLSEKNDDLFKKLLLITGDASKRFTGGFLDFHTYFLALSRDNNWFAGSPANHSGDKEESPMTTVIKATSLERVMRRINQISGGNWPSKKMITLANEERYSPPSITNRASGSGPDLTVTRVFPSGPRPSTIDLSTRPLFY